jgi:hypothetical protein
LACRAETPANSGGLLSMFFDEPPPDYSPIAREVADRLLKARPRERDGSPPDKEAADVLTSFANQDIFAELAARETTQLERIALAFRGHTELLPDPIWEAVENYCNPMGASPRRRRRKKWRIPPAKKKLYLLTTVAVMLLVVIFGIGKAIFSSPRQDQAETVPQLADDRQHQEKAAAEKKAAEKAAADKAAAKKAAAEKAAAERKAAEVKAAADKKAADEQAAAEKKAEEEQAAENQRDSSQPPPTPAPAAPTKEKKLPRATASFWDRTRYDSKSAAFFLARLPIAPTNAILALHGMDSANEYLDQEGRLIAELDNKSKHGIEINSNKIPLVRFFVMEKSPRLMYENYLKNISDSHVMAIGSCILEVKGDERTFYVALREPLRLPKAIVTNGKSEIDISASKAQGAPSKLLDQIAGCKLFLGEGKVHLHAGPDGNVESYDFVDENEKLIKHNVQELAGKFELDAFEILCKGKELTYEIQLEPLLGKNDNADAKNKSIQAVESVSGVLYRVVDGIRVDTVIFGKP